MKTFCCSFLLILLCNSDALGQEKQDNFLDSLQQIAESYYYQSAFDSALIFFEQLEAESKSKAEWQTYAYALLVRFDIQMRLDEYEDAEDALNRCEALFESQLGKDDPYYGYLLNNQGVLYASKSDFQLSIEKYKSSLDFVLSKPDMPFANRIKIQHYLNLASSYTEMRDIGYAISYYKKAYELSRDSILLDPAFVGFSYQAYLNLGYSYRELEQYTEASQALTTAIRILQKGSSKDWAAYIGTYITLANTKLLMQEQDSSFYYLHKAEEYQRKYKDQYGKDYDLESLYSSFGRNYMEIHKVEKAEDYLLKALDKAKTNLKHLKKHPRIGYSIYQLGKLYEKKNELKKALNYYHTALMQHVPNVEIQNPYQNPNLAQLQVRHSGFRSTLQAKADVLYKLYLTNGDLKDLKAAFKAYELLVSAMNLLQNQYKAERSQLFLQEKMLPSFEKAIGISRQLFEETDDPVYLESALHIAEYSKAVLLWAKLKDSEAKFNVGIPDSLLQHERYLAVNKGYYQSRLWEELQKVEPDKKKISKWEENLFELKEQEAQLRDKLEKNFPKYHQLKNPEIQLKLADIIQTLDQAQFGLIEYFWGDSLVFIFALTKEKYQFIELAQDTSNLVQLDILQTLLKNPHSGLEDFKGVSHHIYQTLLQPAIEILPQELNHLIIIPDGPLGLLPYGILLTNSSNQDANFRMLPYLFHNYTIHYGYSLRTILKEYQQASQAQEHKLLAFAPDYTGELKLRFNKPEVQAIEAFFSGESVLADQATKSRFLNMLPGHSILHLAVHGYSDIRNPLMSRLAFYPEEPIEKSELNTYEIYGIQMDAELAVLSSCETGYGKLTQGEGILSLARGFRYAGCKSIIMSLWNADGHASLLIMEDLYAGLKRQLPKNEALQLAISSYLQKAPPEFIHPYYWANFVFMGDGRPLRQRNNYGLVLFGISLLLVCLTVLYYRRKHSRKSHQS